MYVYVHDPYLKDRRFQSTLSIMERRLADFGIKGNTIRLLPISHPRPLLEEEVRRGAKTIVIVGNDVTFSRILASAADLNVTWGFLPIGLKDSNLSGILGIPLNEPSVDVLAARKLEKVDYGLINGKYFFISYLHVPSSKIKIFFEDSFTIESVKNRQELAVSNLLPPPFDKRKRGLHPSDGRFEAYIRPEHGSVIASLFKSRAYYEPSIFSFQKMVVTAERPVKIFADGREMIGKKIVVEVAPGKIKLIVGKNRKF